MAAITCKSLASRMDTLEARISALESAPKAVAVAPAVKATPKNTVAAVKVERTYDTSAAAVKGGYKKGDMVTVPASSVRCVNANVTVAEVYTGVVTGTGSTPAKNMAKAPEGSLGYTDAITIAGSGKNAAVVYIWQGTATVKVIGRFIAPVATVA